MIGLCGREDARIEGRAHDLKFTGENSRVLFVAASGQALQAGRFGTDQHVKEHLGGIFAGGLPDCLPVGGGLVGGVGLVVAPLFAAGLEIAQGLVLGVQVQNGDNGQINAGQIEDDFFFHQSGRDGGGQFTPEQRGEGNGGVLAFGHCQGCARQFVRREEHTVLQSLVVGFGRAVLYGVQGHIPPGTHFFPPVGFGGLVDAGSDAGGNAGGHDFALDVAAAVLLAATGEHIKLGDGEMVDHRACSSITSPRRRTAARRVPP